jgi:hypothetical protein
MRQYLTDKHKKLILEEYLVDTIQASEDVNYTTTSIINIDIATLIDGDKTGLTIVFRYQTIENPFSEVPDTTYKYTSKHVPLYIENNKLICRPIYTLDVDETIDMINVILKTFYREHNLDKIV